MRGVAVGAGLLAGLVAGGTIDVAGLGDPRLRLQRVIAVLDDHDDVADTTLIRRGQDDVAHPETAIRGHGLIRPIDFLETAGLHAGAEVPGPEVVGLKQGLVSPRHAVGVVETVTDRTGGQGGAVGTLGRRDSPMGVSRGVPTASVLPLAVAHRLLFADSPGDLSGDAADGHATPPCCSSQPAAKLIGPALKGLSQARATFL